MKPTRETLLKVLLPVIVLAGAVLASRAILGSRPEPVTREARVTSRSVEAIRVAPLDYPVILRSRGAVRPTVANTLVAEVTASVTTLADAFVVGGAFERGETLVQFDRRDYEIALTRSRAALAQAVARLEEEAALAEQARLEWRQLGRRGEPSALTLREPQLAAARAERDAAAAELERAELDLERTTIVAPYAGRVLERAVDAGQFVSRGGTVGRIHAIDSVEVTLPLGVREQAFLVLPDGERAPAVVLEAASGGAPRRWTGTLVRVEGVDAATRQLGVVARVSDPWADPAAPLRVGQYVEATIEGRVLEDVFVVPRTAVREGREVLVVDEEDRLGRRPVRIAWSDEVVSAVTDGLDDGDRIVLTPLGSVVDGAPVRVATDASPGAGEGEGGTDGSGVEEAAEVRGSDEGVDGGDDGSGGEGAREGVDADGVPGAGGDGRGT